LHHYVQVLFFVLAPVSRLAVDSLASDNVPFFYQGVVSTLFVLEDNVSEGSFLVKRFVVLEYNVFDFAELLEVEPGGV